MIRRHDSGLWVDDPCTVIDRAMPIGQAMLRVQSYRVRSGRHAWWTVRLGGASWSFDDTFRTRAAAFTAARSWIARAVDLGWIPVADV